MTTIGSIDGTTAGSAVPAGSARAPADANAQLAKLETQLSDWVNCPSGKTSEGKAQIAKITGQIDAIKSQVKKATEQKAPPAATVQSVEGASPAGQKIRLDGLGTKLDVQA
ncbi:MAG: FlxA-like family protein [Paucibacter sp.]|nr:FlxA-like family protein [Roseateles sp.]